MQYRKFVPDMFPLEFHVLVGPWKRKQARRLIPGFRPKYPPGHDVTGKYWDCGTHQVLWLQTCKIETIDHEATLLHEIVHVIQSAGHNLGFTDQDGGCEFYTYGATWLWRNIRSWLADRPAQKTEKLS